MRLWKNQGKRRGMLDSLSVGNVEMAKKLADIGVHSCKHIF